MQSYSVTINSMLVILVCSIVFNFELQLLFLTNVDWKILNRFHLITDRGFQVLNPLYGNIWGYIEESDGVIYSIILNTVYTVKWLCLCLTPTCAGGSPFTCKALLHVNVIQHACNNIQYMHGCNCSWNNFLFADKRTCSRTHTQTHEFTLSSGPSVYSHCFQTTSPPLCLIPQVGRLDRVIAWPGSVHMVNQPSMDWSETSHRMRNSQQPLQLSPTRL